MGDSSAALKPPQKGGGAVGAEKRADIQGLRAVAVLAVIAFHADETALPGGFVGVDVFFVLSGYLITGVLLRPMEAERFSIVDFYRRRVRRLFPALFAMMAGVLALGLLFFPPTLLLEQIESQFFGLIFLSNFYFADQTDYFDLQAELMPLLHTWSLGVEEQFYLLFPPVLYALHRWARKLLWPALAALGAASLAFSQGALGSHEDTAFYHPASRAFELLIGALCVAAEKRFAPPAPVAGGLAFLAVVALAASFGVIDGETPFPGALALAPCVATAVLILTRKALVNRILAARPLAAVGDMSYSLYLWHWPLLVFANFLFPGAALAALAAALLSFPIAAASWRFVERPFLEEKPPRRIFLHAALAVGVLIALMTPVYFGAGLPQRFPPEARLFLQATEDFNKDRYKCHMRSDRPIPYEDVCIYGEATARPSYAVWGDSHGAELARALGERLASRGESLRSITMSGCPATLSRGPVCRDHNLAVLAAIRGDAALRTVVLTSNLHGDDAFARASVAGVKKTALDLKAAGKRVVLVLPIPTYDFDPPSLLALEVRAGRDPATAGMARARYEEKSGAIASDLAEFAHANDLVAADPAALFCDAARCRIFEPEAGVLYYNQGHLSLTGAGLLADRILAEPD